MLPERFIIGQNLDPEMKVYRYISLKQFMHFIENNKTYLTRISSWDDTWEAPTMKLPIQHEDGRLSKLAYSSGMDLFAQCWTSKKESDAMWRIYSASKDGIKIGTTVKKFELLEGPRRYAVDEIFYYENLMEGLKYCDEHSSIMRIFREGLIKREEFSHEQEIRLITINAPNTLEKVLKDEENYLELNLNAKDFIEEIIIDPRAEEYYVETIKKYCERVGIEVVPKKSDLYNDDIFGQTKLVGKWISVK
ncbi:DUF2971 domain-containing protein (plasmid) [Clostridium beijerinckii]|uniref:DUF2971 domain-containing protein n=1 Tax=Clostridium beijerinckii TaxID=1520 RepID=UPI0022264920|nr:DUF2971 domain-containing protein [Clostridium beijerinckii]UYZ39009.1 DUF2971 domain-containing protein [Clostridium beijerinckii]